MEPYLFVCGSGDDPSLEYDWIDHETFAPIVDGRYIWSWGRIDSAGSIHHYRAHVAHKKMIKIAMSNDWENFLLMEDDIYILDRWDTVLSQLTLPKADLVYFGWHCWEFNRDFAVGKNLIIEESWERKGKAWIIRVPQRGVGGFHSVLINKSAYRKLLSMPEVAPLDSMVNRNPHLFSRYMVVPKITHTKNVWSFCEQQHITREIL